MRRVLPTAAAIAALLLLMAPLAGCLQDDVGVRCDVGEYDPTDPDTILNLQALDCESRVCIKYLEGSKGPRCTIPCQEDGDCPSDGVAGCTGFRCRIGASVGGTSCCKFCVCDDDVPSKDVDPEAKNCRNQSAKCPNI